MQSAAVVSLNGNLNYTILSNIFQSLWLDAIKFIIIMKYVLRKGILPDRISLS